MSAEKDLLREKLNEINITSPTETQLDQLLSYYTLLVETNKVMNLTAITDFEEVSVKHFADSLSLLTYTSYVSDCVENKKNCRILDLGTGAGFPGIPLRIFLASESVEIVLLDSLNKRIGFLQKVIDELGLKNISAVHGRAEDFARNPEYREKFDLVVSRAVANLSTLSEYTLPYVKQNGLFIAYKSQAGEDELKNASKAISVLGGKAEKKIDFLLPNTDYERSFIPIRKIKPTSLKYPRKAGLPSKEPIC